jgi:DNA processing protein
MLQVMDTVLPSVEDLTAVFALESIKGFGPQKFRELAEAGLSSSDVLQEPAKLPTTGKRGEAFRAELQELGRRGLYEFERRAMRQIERAQENDASILLHGHPAYPRTLWASNNPVPVLYVRGDVALLNVDRSVACVGSREIREPYLRRQHEFARNAAEKQWLVVSGFAMGADSTAHRAAREAGGATACVMPCGLDRPFPPENKNLWKEFLDYPGAALVSEFAFGTAAATLTLRKRNKTIVGLALGVLIGQSSAKGGAMNAFRFAKEQRKAVATFAPDGQEATTGNAEIITSHGTEFPADQADTDAWDQWLLSLSSST